MGRELAASYPTAGAVYQQADEILGFAISRLSWEGPEQDLNETINTQPALLVHSAAALAVLREEFPEFMPAFAAGHSMGELSALLAAEALPFAAALRLVRRRGELMKEAGDVSPGGMAAILGLDIPTLEQVCAQASQRQLGEFVQVANDNCPGQVVISGARPAMERALVLAQQAGARRAVPLAVSIAAHSPLMSYAQDRFNQAVEEASIQDPALPVIGNVTAAPLVTAAEIRSDLQAQLTHRVRWTESIQFMAANGVTAFIEIGSGTVLAGLLKRIERQAEAAALGNPPDYEKLKN
jgi:[acyl-carrier-protein] S-malonyltransferase